MYLFNLTLGRIFFAYILTSSPRGVVSFRPSPSLAFRLSNFFRKEKQKRNPTDTGARMTCKCVCVCGSGRVQGIVVFFSYFASFSNAQLFILAVCMLQIFIVAVRLPLYCLCNYTRTCVATSLLSTRRPNGDGKALAPPDLANDGRAVRSAAGSPQLALANQLFRSIGALNGRGISSSSFARCIDATGRFCRRNSREPVPGNPNRLALICPGMERCTGGSFKPEGEAGWVRVESSNTIGLGRGA